MARQGDELLVQLPQKTDLTPADKDLAFRRYQMVFVGHQGGLVTYLSISTFSDYVMSQGYDLNIDLDNYHNLSVQDVLGMSVGMALIRALNTTTAELIRLEKAMEHYVEENTMLKRKIINDAKP